MIDKTMDISGWGNFPIAKAMVKNPSSVDELQKAVKQTPCLLPRGAGKSYGDSSLFHTVLNMKDLNRILGEGDDWIEIEAGCTIEQLLLHIVPKGRFLAITPGIKLITIGGAIASNVHGKNHHHVGSFVNQVISLKVVDELGSLIDCGPTMNSGSFYSIFGAMGLTGIVVSAKLKLVQIDSAFLEERQFFTDSIDGLFHLFELHNTQPFIVGWLDMLNSKLSGIIKTANWLPVANLPNHNDRLSTDSKKIINVPFTFPFAPSRFAFKFYNKLYFNKAKKQAIQQLHYNDFFYPLDGISNWNRIFGPAGFVQYHVALPIAIAPQELKTMIEIVRSSKATCTLAVIKMFGPVDERLIHSFPMEGYNIAMDFVNDKHAHALLSQLDLLTKAHGGRVYKAKDSLSTVPTALQSTKFQSNQNIRYGNATKK